MSPWHGGYYFQHPNAQSLWRELVDYKVPHIAAISVLVVWTRGFYLKYFGDSKAGDMLRNAKASRRYYGRIVPRVPLPAHSVRNQMVLQAITRKMILEGKAHNIHIQQALNSLPK